jgi:thioredoxin-like negative regulator of GroEL
MLLSLFLLLLAQNVPQPAANGPADLSAAIQLAQQGRNAEALAALQKIAAADPNDHLTRLWIANVHARMGRSRHGSSAAGPHFGRAQRAQSR